MLVCLVYLASTRPEVGKRRAMCIWRVGCDLTSPVLLPPFQQLGQLLT